jgi:N-terminal domain of (some) glycogen debranching enzymes
VPRGLADESPAVPASSLTLTEGTPFVLCGGAGDIGDAALDGVFVGDTRICDGLVLTVGGARIEVLATTRTSPFQAATVGRIRTSALLVFRERWVGSGPRDDVRLRNVRPSDRHLTVTYLVGSDLAGLFAVKDAHPPAGRATASIHDGFPGLGRSDGPVTTSRPYHRSSGREVTAPPVGVW